MWCSSGLDIYCSVDIGVDVCSQVSALFVLLDVRNSLKVILYAASDVKKTSPGEWYTRNQYKYQEFPTIFDMHP